MNEYLGFYKMDNMFSTVKNTKPLELSPEDELKAAIHILKNNNLNFYRTINILRYSLAEIEKEDLSKKIKGEIYGRKS